ncbi:MAG: GYD domain-containing protein [Chloroflexi bacterium]|nr:GYD domain-containing protein [Chloroflexota bacterium]
MATYIILSRISPGAFGDPKDFKKLATSVSAKIKSECPGVKWRESYFTMGRFDIVDVVESEDPRQVERAAMLIRGHGHCRTETLPATSWKEFMAHI